jgi:hypothetical protein
MGFSLSGIRSFDVYMYKNKIPKLTSYFTSHATNHSPKCKNSKMMELVEGNREESVQMWVWHGFLSYDPKGTIHKQTY